MVETEVLSIAFDAFLTYVRQTQQPLLALVSAFCTRLSEAERRVEVLAQRGAEERLGGLLLQLVTSRGRPSRVRTKEVAIPVSHEQLAQLAAMSRPHVTVTLGKLRKQGFIRYNEAGLSWSAPVVLGEYLGRLQK